MPNPKILDVVAGNGVPFRVVLLVDGDSVNRHLANKLSDGKPLVEFYDFRYAGDKFTADGQFVADYYLDTLLNDSPGAGINLSGGVPDWSIDGRTFAIVLAWLTHHSDDINTYRKQD